MRIKQKKSFFWRKKFKIANFSKSPFFIIAVFQKNFAKFHRLVLGFGGLINAKGINVAQHIWSWDCLTLGQKQHKITKNAFLACFCPYVRQPHNHIGWAELMAFASINPTNPRTNLWNFREKISRIGDFEKRPFWKIGHFEFFSSKFFFFLLHSHENQSKFLW